MKMTGAAAVFNQNPDFLTVREQFIGLFSEEEIIKRLSPASEAYKIDQITRNEEIKNHAGYSDYSKVGFLGEGEGLDVIKDDYLTLEENHITYEGIARLVRLLLSGGDKVKLQGAYLQSTKTKKRLAALGQQTCPWGCDVPGGNVTETILADGATEQEVAYAQTVQHPTANALLRWKDLPTSGRELLERASREFDAVDAALKNGERKRFFCNFNALSPHLIEKHRFFQGYGSPYRVDPGFLLRVATRKGPLR